MSITFTYDTGVSKETGSFWVDDNSTLYGLDKGDQFSIQFDPQRPSSYYSAEAKSLSQTIRRAIIFIMVAFVAVVILAELSKLKQ